MSVKKYYRKFYMYNTFADRICNELVIDEKDRFGEFLINNLFNFFRDYGEVNSSTDDIYNGILDDVEFVIVRVNDWGYKDRV